MGATTSRGAADAAWEHELGASRGAGVTPLPRGVGLRNSSATSPASASGAVADPASSHVHRQFAWHLVIVFGGFVAVRWGWLWLESARAMRSRNEQQQQRQQEQQQRSRRDSPRRKPRQRTHSPRSAVSLSPPSTPGAERAETSPKRRDSAASYLDPKTTPTVHPFDETTTANVSQGKWVTIRALGRGSFGTVTLVRNVDTGVYAALKQVPVGEAGQLTREFGLLCNLKPHPHVVRVLGAAVRGHKARLFLEYCPNGSLADVLRPRQPQPEPFVRSCIRQILEGLAFLHHHNILHRDIKPANILVDSCGVLKIADFGLSRHIDSLKTHTVQAGSPAYMSPESIRGQLSSGSDLWSVAATMCEMLSGELPWSHLDAFRAGKEPLLLYIGTHPDEHPEIPAHASPEARDLLKVLFRADPKARGTAAVALLHPFFAMEAPHTPLSHTASLVSSLPAAAAAAGGGAPAGQASAIPVVRHGRTASRHNHHHLSCGSLGGTSLSRQASGHTFGPPCSMEVTSDGDPTPPPPLAGVSGIAGGSTLHTDPGVSF